MARHRSYSIEFKHQVAQEYLGGESLSGWIWLVVRLSGADPAGHGFGASIKALHPAGGTVAAPAVRRLPGSGRPPARGPA